MPDAPGIRLTREHSLPQYRSLIRPKSCYVRYIASKLRLVASINIASGVRTNDLCTVHAEEF